VSPSSQTPLTQEQLIALSSPVRVSIFGTLRLLGPQTMKSIAAYLKARPDALYYHVKLLISAGIIEVKEIRQAHKKKEAVFGLVAAQYTISSFEGDSDYAAAVMGLVEASTAYALAGFRRASANLAGPEPEFHLVHGRLSPQNFGRWKQSLELIMTEGFRDEGEDAIPVMACAIVLPA
jgi:DNA-binding transcriptional ArsR family regulator